MTTRLVPLLWLFSFALALMPFPAFEAHFFMGAFGLLAIGLCFIVLKYPFPEKIPPFYWIVFAPLILFWALALASAVLSAAPYTSFIYFCFFSVFPLSFFWSLAPSPFRESAIAGTGLAVIFAALSIWSLAQYFFLPQMLLHRHVHWPFADSSSLGGILSLAFFGALGLMLGAKNRLQSNAGLFLALLLVSAIFTTGSRGSLLFLILGSVVFTITARAHIRRHGRCCAALLAGSVAAFFLIGMLGPEGTRPPMEIIAKTLSGQLPVFWARPDIWASAWDIIKDHFWTGTGIGTFYLYYPQYRSGDAMTAGRMAHSDPLQFWAEMGVFAPVLFYAFIAAVTYATFMVLKKLEPDDARRVYILSPFCALGALVAHAHVTFHFNVLPILMLAGFFLAFWFHNVRQVLEGAFSTLPSLRLPERSALKGALIVALLAAAYPFLMLQSSEIVLQRAHARSEASDAMGFVNDVNIAGRMSQQKNANAIILAAGVSLSILENGMLMSPGQRESLPRQGENLLERAESLNPLLPTIPFTRARYARQAKRTDREEEWLREALRLDPLYFPARMQLTEALLRKNEKTQAYEVLKEGLRWREAADVPLEYYQFLATLSLEQGDNDAHMIALRKMAQHHKADR